MPVSSLLRTNFYDVLFAFCEQKVCISVRFDEQRRSMTTSKELNSMGEKEKKLIPVMIKQYCHGKHGTRGEALCEECRALTEYALLRLESVLFKGQ